MKGTGGETHSYTYALFSEKKKKRRTRSGERRARRMEQGTRRSRDKLTEIQYSSGS